MSKGRLFRVILCQLYLLGAIGIAISACEGSDGTDDPAAGGGGTDEPPGAEDPCTGEGSCANEGVCDVYECGGPAAAFNHFGCPRVGCDDDGDCPTAEACFVRAYDADCLPSSVTCEEEAGACACATTDDCGGVVQAHCLPTEFYPKSEYCPVDLGCSELNARRDAIATAEAHHQDAGNVDLASDLAGCVVALDPDARAGPS